MAIKPIGPGLTLFAVFPAAALSGPTRRLNPPPPRTPPRPLVSPRKARYAPAVGPIHPNQPA